MNALPYEVKRAHWRATWFAIRKFRTTAKKIAQPMLNDMTPARFDILYIAWRADWRVHARRKELGLPMIERRIPLADLKGLLGLAGTTVSRTAHRLEELGYVRIEPHPLDRRAKMVVITWRGARLLRMAVQCITQESGMRDNILREVMHHEEIAPEDPFVFERTVTSLGTIIDRVRSYARFFWCKSTPIYDARVVTHYRPHAASMLGGWGGTRM